MRVIYSYLERKIFIPLTNFSTFLFSVYFLYLNIILKLKNAF